MSSTATKPVPAWMLVALGIGGSIAIALVLNVCLAAPQSPLSQATSASVAQQTAARVPLQAAPTASLNQIPPAGDVPAVAPTTAPAAAAGPAQFTMHVVKRAHRTVKVASHARAKVIKLHATPTHRPAPKRARVSIEAVKEATAQGTAPEITWVGRDGHKWHAGESIDQSQFPTAKPLGPADQNVIRTVIQTAGQQNGTPYVWGGNTPGSFDCSGLIQYAYSQAGLSLPRTTYGQWGAIPHVKNPADLMPGDIVFFENLGHEALYVGNDYVMEAPHTGAFVRGVPLSIISAEDGYVGAVRPSSMHR